MILDLLLINIIMVLIHESGFITTIDSWVNKKWRFYHLPYPIRCMLCGTWWISLGYIIITGQLSLLGIMLCLLNAHLTEITQGIWRTIKTAVMDLLGWINKYL